MWVVIYIVIFWEEFSFIIEEFPFTSLNNGLSSLIWSVRKRFWHGMVMYKLAAIRETEAKNIHLHFLFTFLVFWSETKWTCHLLEGVTWISLYTSDVIGEAWYHEDELDLSERCFPLERNCSPVGNCIYPELNRVEMGNSNYRSKVHACRFDD